MKIDLAGTTLADREFPVLAEHVNEGGWPLADRWPHCYVADGVWNGAGAETKLPVILKAFLRWARGD